MHHAIGDVGVRTGGQTRPTPASQYPSEQIVEIQRYGPPDQPWSLGAVRSRPSFESSLRTIRRRRPSARKTRRRLIALAGTSDKIMSVKTNKIATEARLVGVTCSLASVMPLVRITISMV